jgi:hypothetical protein
MRSSKFESKTAQTTRVPGLFTLDDLRQQCPQRTLARGAWQRRIQDVGPRDATLLINYVADSAR